MNQNELCAYQRKAVPLPPKSAEHAENPEQSTQNRYTIEWYVVGIVATRTGYSDCSGGIGFGALFVGVLA